MLTLFVVVVVYLVLKSLRVADWLALIAAFGSAYAARVYLPAFDIGVGDFGVFFLVALVLTPFWLGPMVIYQTQKQSAAPSFEPFNAELHTVPESIGVGLAESEAALIGTGFSKVGEYFQTGFMQNLTTRVALFECPEHRQYALVVGMYMNTDEAKLIANYVEMVARFKDGRSLAVNNSPVLGSYGPVAGKTVEQFPEVRDPRRLVRLHRALMEQMGARDELKELEPGIDGAKFLVESMLREFEQQLNTGYLRFDAAANAYRPTVKGAILMTWKQVPPVSTIRMKRVRRRAAELVVALGVTEPDENPSTVPGLQKTHAWPVLAVAAVVIIYFVVADTGERKLSAADVPEVASMTLPADFTVPADFPGAVKAIETLTGVAAEQLVVVDSLGFPVQTDGAMFGIEAARADSLLAAAQPVLLERGFFLFRHEPNYGIGGKPDEIGLVPLGDQFAVVKRVGTNGANYDLTSEKVVAWLRELNRDAPFILTGIGYDHVEGRFLQPIGAKADSIAVRVHKFCPDVVDQGTGSVRELGNEIGRLNTFFCWWD